MSRWIHLNMPTYASIESIVCDREWVWCKGMTHGQTNLTGVGDTELRAKHILLKHTAYSLKLPIASPCHLGCSSLGPDRASCLIQRLLSYTFRWCQRQLLRVLRRMVRLPKVGQTKTSTNHLAIDRWLCWDRECTRSHRWQIAGASSGSLTKAGPFKEPLPWKELGLEDYPEVPLVTAGGRCNCNISYYATQQLSSRRYQRNHVQKCSDMFRSSYLLQDFNFCGWREFVNTDEESSDTNWNKNSN